MISLVGEEVTVSIDCVEHDGSTGREGIAEVQTSFKAVDVLIVDVHFS